MSSLHRHLSGNTGALGAGLTFALSVALFAYGGLWLDGYFGTKPWCMVALVLCGIVGGTLHVIRVLAPEMWPFGELASPFDKPVSRPKRSPDNSEPSPGEAVGPPGADPTADDESASEDGAGRGQP
ncbi:MAG: AtpZ/AtpI family protein [bacterium]|nr:AtpZ/AtpI family protein [bacterium]